MKTRLLTFFLAMLVFIPACTTWQIIRYNYSGIDDHEIFPFRTLPASSAAYSYAYNTREQRMPEEFSFKGRTFTLSGDMAKLNTRALLIIKNDTIVYENYYAGYSDTTLSTIFSISKAVMSMLIGCAIADNYIAAVSDSVPQYIPELSANGFDGTTIEHLLQMTSGINYSTWESMPFGKPSYFYYSDDLRHETLNLRVDLDGQPCEPFAYRSGNYQILALLLERALQDEYVSDYFTRRVLAPLGTEYDATWSIDRPGDGMEKAFANLNMRARDLAKIASLYLHNGNWRGQQIVPAAWVSASTRRDSSACSAPYYQYGWWLISEKYGDYCGEGDHGQFLYINPRLQVVIVRFGQGLGNLSYKEWKQLLTTMAEVCR
jgi:CubicO group peptidase (beta-lactamase class C family)